MKILDYVCICNHCKTLILVSVEKIVLMYVEYTYNVLYVFKRFLKPYSILNIHVCLFGQFMVSSFYIGHIHMYFGWTTLVQHLQTNVHERLCCSIYSWIRTDELNHYQEFDLVSHCQRNSNYRQSIRHHKKNKLGNFNFKHKHDLSVGHLNVDKWKCTIKLE